MGPRPSRVRWRVFAARLLVTAMSTATAHAEVTFDGSLGAQGSLSGQMIIDAARGTRAGANLFHSFGLFNVRSGESATFAGPSDIVRIIGRVTGDGASIIDGPVMSTIPGVSLYLLNADGFALGPNATLDIPGTLVVSSATQVTFVDGARLPIDAAIAPATLSHAALSEFGFVGQSPAAITFDRALLRAGRIGVVGGALDIRDATLYSPGGRIDLIAQSDGSVVLGSGAPAISGSGAGADISLVLTDFANLRVLDDGLRANLDTTGAPAGPIYLRGNDLTVDGAFAFADSIGGVATAGLDVALSGNLDIVGGGRLTSDSIDPSAAGRAGGVRLATAGRIAIAGAGSAIAANAILSGRAGDVRIDAGTLALTDDGAIQSIAASTGDAGAIDIRANSIDLSTGGRISSSTQGAGNGGAIRINTARFTADRASPLTQGDAGVEVSTLGGGDAGSLRIDAADFRLGRGASLQSFTAENSGAGRAGTIEVFAQRARIDGGVVDVRSFSDDGGGRVAIVGTERIDTQDATLTARTLVGRGAGGDLTLSAPRVTLTDSTIEASTSGVGNGGNVSVTGNQLVFAGADVSVSTTAVGAGGRLAIGSANAIVTIGDGSRIASSTTSTGNAGDVRIAGALITVDGSGPRGAAIATASTSTRADAGTAGRIAIDGGALVMNGGTISASIARGASIADAQRSDIEVSLTDSITLRNNARIEADTSGSAQGGRVAVSATIVDLADAASLATTASGTGNSGSVSIAAVDDVLIRGTARVTTDAARSQGGDVVVRAGRLVRLTDGSLNASAGAAGMGGNVDVGARTIVLQRGAIFARADAGNGGRIDLAADAVLTDPASVISADSNTGTAGTVNIRAPDDDVSAAVTPQDAAPLAVPDLSSDPCASGQATSSLVNVVPVRASPTGYVTNLQGGGATLASAGCASSTASVGFD